MAAAGSRTLKLSILADIDDLKKNLNVGSTEVDSFGSKVTDFGKKAGLAFAAAAAAAGAYAIKIGVDGVKAAIEDEQSQVKLASALKNATGATNDQIASVEKQILKMSLATGVSDDKLRPALSRLAISTEDASKAQELLSLALDISTQTGKPLETVANSLGKAYDGNTTALGKLGVGLSSAELKTMDFTQVQTRLSDLFGGAAARNAQTFQGRMDILKTTFNEAKETIGYAFFPILEKLVGYFTQYVVPIVEKLSNAFSDKSDGLTSYITNLGTTLSNVFTPIWNGLVKAFGYVKDAIGENMDAFLAFGKLIADYVAPVLGTTLGAALQIVGKIAGGVINIIGGIIGAITTAVEAAIGVINWLITKYNSIPLLPNIPTIPVSGAPTVKMPTVSTSGITTSTTIPKIALPSTSTSGTTSTSVSSAASSAAKAAASIAGGGFTDSQNAARLAAMGAGGFTDSQNAARISITVNGAIDPEGTARTIVDTLNNSAYRGTGGSSNLVAV